MTPFGIFIGEALKNQDTHTRHEEEEKRGQKENGRKEKKLSTQMRGKCYYILAKIK
jgi:hypothetical protein